MSSPKKLSLLTDLYYTMSMFNNLKEMFTDDEWTIIDRALSEYQDHFDGSDTEEEIIYNQVCDKISDIFSVTQ